MKTVVFQSFNNPEMGMAIEFSDEDYEEGKRIAALGWNAWWQSQQGNWDRTQIVGNIEVNQEYVDDCWALGYSEPARELLDEANIKYRVLDECYDENGDFEVPEREYELIY